MPFISRIIANRVSDLAYTPGTAGDAAWVLGYNNPNDGGGGPVRQWKAGRALTADGVLVINDPTTDTTSWGQWVAAFSGPVDPVWFGAAGDDVADDTTPLVTANAAALYWDTSIVITKPYRLGNNITFDAGLRFEADGQLNIDSGKTLNILGEIFAGTHTIFNGSGTRTGTTWPPVNGSSVVTSVGDGSTSVIYYGGTRISVTAKSSGFTAAYNVTAYALTAQMTAGSPCVIDNTLPEGTQWTFIDYTNNAATAPHRFTLADTGSFFLGGGDTSSTFDLSYSYVTLQVISGKNVVIL